MEKIKLYPKTTRYREGEFSYLVTEKLDGSNLTFLKLDGELWIGQRKYIYRLSEIDNPEVKGIMYKGLYEFLVEYGKDLEAKIYEGSAVCGEWLGMGKIKYEMPHRFYMFAKARYKSGELVNFYYNPEMFHYVFNGDFPSYIGIVPFVTNFGYYPSLKELDELYSVYSLEEGRPVEGFVITSDPQNLVRKYVRFKKGVMTPHKEG